MLNNQEIPGGVEFAGLSVQRRQARQGESFDKAEWADLPVEAAMKAVPDDLADGIALCGPLDRIRERVELWRKTPVTTILAGGVRNPEHLKALADIVNG